MGKLSFVKSRWFLAAICLLLGAVVILGIRFFTYKQPDKVHYHANFALYINGQQEQFKGPQYYEEEAAMCSANKTVTPEDRAHMHDNVNNVVHIEDHAVTWGQFFTNLGWTLGPTFMASPTGTVYAEKDSNQLHLLLNNQDYTGLGGLTNKVIQDQDKLLISYGDESQATLQQEYSSIPSTAHHYDVTPDPKTCSGSQGPTIKDRLAHLF